MLSFNDVRATGALPIVPLFAVDEDIVAANKTRAAGIWVYLNALKIDLPYYSTPEDGVYRFLRLPHLASGKNLTRKNFSTFNECAKKPKHQFSLTEISSR